ncbi:MAG: DUF2452 domain-containing protein [Salibacteraceae bacterium]
MNEQEGGSINPIDKDKTTEEPGRLAYPHHIGSPVVKPVDKGKVKGRAMTSMMQQTESQLQQIYQQMQLLADQAKAVKDRVEISEKIYESDMGFEPIVGHQYYLYQKENGRHVLSMLSPEEWGKRMPYSHLVSAVRLLADHTWDLLN